jgi:hypothetical protein
MGSYCAIVSLSFLALSSSFHYSLYPMRKPILVISAHKNVSGSFFNPVPNNRDDDNQDNKETTSNHSSHSSDMKPDSSIHPSLRLDPFDQSMAELLKKNKHASLDPKSLSNDRETNPKPKAIGMPIIL